MPTALRSDSSNFLSRAFDDRVVGARARGVLREIADVIALELRLSQELLPIERDEGCRMAVRAKDAGGTKRSVQYISALGDQIVAADYASVLEVVERSVVLEWFHGSYARNNEAPVRRAYGYSDPAFSSYGARATERTMVCVAADVWFNPYACGFWDATVRTRADLRVDLRAVMNLIWVWATFEHRALAYALSAARLHPKTSQWMPFEPFTMLYRRVLALHREDDDHCDAAAAFLSAFTVERLRLVKPGRTSRFHLYGPALAALRDHSDTLTRIDLTDSSRDALAVFAADTAPFLRKVFLGEIPADQAIAAVRRMADGIEVITR